MDSSLEGRTKARKEQEEVTSGVQASTGETGVDTGVLGDSQGSGRVTCMVGG